MIKNSQVCLLRAWRESTRSTIRLKKKRCVKICRIDDQMSRNEPMLASGTTNVGAIGAGQGAGEYMTSVRMTNFGELDVCVRPSWSTSCGMRQTFPHSGETTTQGAEASTCFHES